MYIDRLVRLPENRHFFLFGPRQTGKSTLIKNRFLDDSCIVYDLLHSETYRRLVARPEILRQEITTALSQKEISHVVIDEVQKIPELLDEVHALIELPVSCSFILSGSSARKLKRVHANMLGGRAWTYKLFPLSYFEVGSNFDLRRALRFGTLPSIYCAQNDFDRKEILRSYITTYIDEEIKLEAQLRNIGGFLRFLSIAASENGNMVNFSNIARETGVKHLTVKSFYQILEDTLVGYFLLPYGKSIRKKMAKHPKFYFFDTGVVSALTNKLNLPVEEKSSEYGQSFEHFFINEVVKINEYYRLDFDISFYRTERGAEVDCIITTPSGRIIAIEIKSIDSPRSVHCKGLMSFYECTNNAELILACQAPRPLQIGNVMALPWQQALERIKQSY
ncbi:MAG: ATP-binding protein [bacterium]